MRKITVFIAMSLDGYIADHNSGVAWLNGQGNDSENIDAYSEFVKEIDTVIMGWNTYHQIAAELSVNDWPYEEFTTYVFTHKKRNILGENQIYKRKPCLFDKTAKRKRRKRNLDLRRSTDCPVID